MTGAVSGTHRAPLTRDSTDLPLRAKLAAVVAVAVLVIVVGSLAVVSVRSYQRAAMLVDHTREVQRTLGLLLQRLTDAETGQRGFLLTGDVLYLDPYRGAAADVATALATLRTLTADDPEQQRRLDALAPLIAQRLDTLNRRIEVWRRDGLEAAVTGLAAGRALMTEVRGLVSEMNAAEESIKTARTAAVERRATIAVWVILVGSIVSFALLLLITAAIRRDVRAREAAHRFIEEQNAELESQAVTLADQQQELELQLEESQAMTEELTATNAERERLVHALERTNKELDQFAYVASHDLKAPLRGIANLSSWIEEDVGDAFSEDARAKMNLLRGRVHRLEALIDGILEYSRAGRSQATPDRVDTSALVAEVVELLAPPPTARVEVAADLPDVVAERVPLSQVFSNLIGNALKYSGRPDTVIRVSGAPEGRFVRFSVADDGPGIAAQYHEKIFVVFQTLASRDKVEGTGIGLSVVKKIVEARGGRVWVESPTDAVTGTGSTFHFTWPRGPGTEQ